MAWLLSNGSKEQTDIAEGSHPVSRAQVGWTVVCVDCSEDDDAGANDDIIADAVDAAPGPPRAQDIRAHPFGEPWTGAGGGSKNFESA